MFVAGLLVAGPILVHFFWYKPNPTAHRRYVLDNIEAWLFWAAANVLISWWLAMIIDVVPAIFRGIVALSWGHVSEKIKTRIEMYNSVRGSVKPLFYAASGWVSWIILFEHIYKLYDGDDPSQSQASYTERVRLAFCPPEETLADLCFYSAFRCHRVHLLLGSRLVCPENVVSHDW